MKTRVNVSPFAQLLQQKSYLPWLVYGLSTLLVVLIQNSPRFFPELWFARPAPLPLFVICVAVFSGARTGAAIGVLAGVLWGVFSSHVFGYDALILMLFGSAGGLLVEWFLRANFFTALLLSFCGELLYILLEWLFFYIFPQKENIGEILFKVLLPNGLYTVVLIPLVYWFAYTIARYVRRKKND